MNARIVSSQRIAETQRELSMAEAHVRLQQRLLAKQEDALRVAKAYPSWMLHLREAMGPSHA